jgi:regulator of replication initiation timing
MNCSTCEVLHENERLRAENKELRLKLEKTEERRK